MTDPNAPDLPIERSLDPEDWTALRDLGHRMVDDMFEWLSSQRERPLHNPVPATTAARFEEPPPAGGESAEEVYRAFREEVLPHPHGNVHPRFWGWVVGSGTPIGMLAEMLAAGINTNSGFGDHCAPHLEGQVLRWLREAMGFPADGGGVLTSGCSIANLTGLAVARERHAGWNVRAEGLQRGVARLTVYGSSETHSSSLRALEILGLGRSSFRSIPTDSEHRIRLDLLTERLHADRRAGLRPVAILGSAGTVNVGAFDDLEGLADLAQREGLWLHVDGAFGAMAALVPSLRSKVRGMERADSLAFDLHKWLHVPYDAGCVLFRERAPQAETFELSGAYLSKFESGMSSGPENYMSQGLQMSRGFRALKTWMTIRHYGFERLGEAVLQNIRQARYLASLAESAPELELLAPVPLNIVNLRYRPSGWDESDPRLNPLNRDLLAKLHASGLAAPSHTELDGRFSLRFAITNHRSRREDFDATVAWLLDEGPRLAARASAEDEPGAVRAAVS